MARRKEKKENSGLKKFVIFLAILVIAFPAAAFGYVYFKLNVMHDSSADESILNENNYQAEKGITNILLAGTDGRPGEESSRSDAMMILTVDTVNKSLKLTSLNRDTYVDIPGHGYQKLTHAYAYGGVNLLTETIENNFEIDIQDYAVVDFYSFMDIVDALGGVEVDVHQNEISETNKFIKKETYEWSKKTEPIQLIEHSGIQKLNGYQTLSYARIRKNDSTQERDRRQRAVIEGLMNGVKNLPVSKYPKLLDTVLPYVKTDMKPTEIIGLAGKVLGIGNLAINQIEFPFDNASTSVTLPGAGFVIKYEPESLNILHDFIFKNIIP
ncbi:LCP family protein [Romboutsia sp. 13368]|uniref:LCP family protein n=1 Tax=Romboutsia sp. 13368 TaxID=2708053 RepID=UPI0025E4E92D|nr:LCP family protein [Romboutsia sp. 13368]